MGEPGSGAAIDATGGLPETPVGRWIRPLARFLAIETASGFALLGCAAIALVVANSPAAGSFHAFWETRLAVTLGPFTLDHTLHEWLNEGLMTIFFFVVGLEIKREFVAGELSEPRKAVLPLAAAFGGMVAPAVVYLASQGGLPGESGWGIPVATDIAFVVGCLALLGRRVPHGLKIFVLSLAIVDDIGAVLIIAIGYSDSISVAALALGIAGLGLCVLFNRIGVRPVPVYAILGVGVWLPFLLSGVHPTVAGVALGLLTPARAWIDDRSFLDVIRRTLARLGGERPRPAPQEAVPEEGVPHERHAMLMNVALTARETVAPLERLETTLHPWVAFAIMPLFALGNAGVHFTVEEAGDPVALAVVTGLVLGKPLGIFTFSWISVRLGLAHLPTGVDWRVVFGAGCLAGIGFTMSLFIAELGLDETLLSAGKLGVLIGSALSAGAGLVLLNAFLGRPGPASGEPSLFGNAGAKR